MAKSRRTGIDLNQWPIIVLIGLVLLTVLTWAVFNATKDNIPGTDFFIYYVAARQVTVDQGSPYAETVGEQSQIAVLKHPARPGEDQLRYVYPPYGLITILPLSVLPFSWAQAIWMSCSILGLLLSVLYGFRRISPVFLVTFFFLYPLTFGLLLGNLNMPVTVILILLAGRLKNLTNNQRIESVILGVLMAWATIKPQFSTFFILKQDISDKLFYGRYSPVDLQFRAHSRLGPTMDGAAQAVPRLYRRAGSHHTGGQSVGYSVARTSVCDYRGYLCALHRLADPPVVATESHVHFAVISWNIRDLPVSPHRSLI
jgi:hypothetical protein